MGGADDLGGLTIADALAEFEEKGYTTQFIVRSGAVVECRACGASLAPRTVPIDAARRVEGVSDPADMALVGALECPRCWAHGTLVVKFGPAASAEDAKVLRELADHRHAIDIVRHTRDDDALVRDTGWLAGPDG